MTAMIKYAAKESNGYSPPLSPNKSSIEESWIFFEQDHRILSIHILGRKSPCFANTQGFKEVFPLKKY